MIIGGINWGLVGLFQFDFVGWLLGGSSSIWSRIVFTVVGIAAVCGIPGLFTDDDIECDEQKRATAAAVALLLGQVPSSQPIRSGRVRVSSEQWGFASVRA